jgi:hypothetical protein
MRIIRPGIHNTTTPYHARKGIHDPVWVVGCIDSYGAIHARHAAAVENTLHGPNESKGTRWRWNIQEQKFVLTALLESELATVVDWLERKGYKSLDAAPRM